MSQNVKILNAAVIVSALGYFVDIYDLLLFGIVRVASLKSLGVADTEILSVGVKLLNSQMAGMLIGGVIWGILGDKRGRVSVLFGSIFLYSVANILNAFVVNVSQYEILRFIAGVGLAGELGAAITLVSEILPKETRGYGTTIVASFGICGAVLAGIIGDNFTWSTAYLVGGGLGLLLLLLRMTTLESTLFKVAKEQESHRGDIFLLFKNRSRIRRYLNSILVGLPIWFVIGILITFSPEISRELQIAGSIQAGRAILFTYIGLAAGDLGSGLLSQWFRSRKKIIFAFLVLTVAAIFIYTQLKGVGEFAFYASCMLLGFAVGYWALFVSAAAEQFGTNLRATVTTTVPNFNRGSVVPLTLTFRYLHQAYGLSLVASASAIAILVMAIAFVALYFLDESFGKDLNYFEV